MDIVENLDKEQTQEALSLDIRAHLQAAYDSSCLLTNDSGLDIKERDAISLGIHRLKENIMITLDLKEVDL